jgi:hypothetical protein
MKAMMMMMVMMMNARSHPHEDSPIGVLPWISTWEFKPKGKKFHVTDRS